jgi:protein ImuB
LPNRLYLALFFPLFSADRWRREAGTGAPPGPVALIERQGGAMRIAAPDAQARALGLACGMALADARARIPGLATVPHDPAADAALLERIADDCERYTPSIALDPPDGLILDITGCAHLRGGEAALTGQISARLSHSGLDHIIATAPTPDRARALARHGETLPVAALEPDAAQAAALRRAGLHRVADLAARPRRIVAARFGLPLVTRLARILGEEDARITPRRSLPAISVLRRLSEPVGSSGLILSILGDLVRDACGQLRERDEGGRRFAARLFRSDGAVHQLTVETGQPVRAPGPVLRLFEERIDSLADPLDPGFGYDAVRLDVPHTEPLLPGQAALEHETVAGPPAAEMLDRLAVRLGGERVRRLAAGNSHIPELAGFTLPASRPALPFAWPAPEAGEPPLRPLLLFDPPQPVDVIAEVPDGPPRTFRWRRRLHEIVAHEGPERIASEWWKRHDGHSPGKGGLTRDYYRVEDSEGRRFWLFRHGLYGTEKAFPGWYLHGRFA